MDNNSLDDMNSSGTMLSLNKMDVTIDYALYQQQKVWKMVITQQYACNDCVNIRSPEKAY